MGDRSSARGHVVKAAEFYADVHLEACALADLRQQQDAILARVRAMRSRAEASLERARAHTIPARRFIRDVQGVVVCED